jgi:glutamate-1-semialdehyde 2,1-aminomutase
MPDEPVTQVEKAAVQAYVDQTPGSLALARRARRVLPGGNTRTCVHQHPHPLAGQKGSGSYLWDIDGNRYIDLYLNGLSLIHGHAYEPIVERLQQVVRRGTAWSASSDEQVALAELLCARIPSAERVRFCTSGTEAGMLAAKLCRHVTGRPLLLKADIGYHGAFDDLEAGLHGQGALPGRTLLAPYGDAAAFERVLARHGDSIAGVFIEPASVSTAVSPPREFFTRLKTARERCSCSTSASRSATPSAGCRSRSASRPT